jgi:hypothetical protein
MNKHDDENDSDPELEQHLTESMYVEEDNVPYPDDESWHNLGQTIRDQSRSDNRWNGNRILRLVMWPAVAAVVALVLRFSGPPVASTEKKVEVVPRPDIMIAHVETAESGDIEAQFRALEVMDLQAELEVMELQAELDAIALELASADQEEDDAHNAILDAWDIDSEAVLFEYFSAL